VPLPADLQGELDGVPYRIRVPANWNGTLFVYGHGYGDTAIPPALAPLPADEDTLLARGFALAASRFAGAVPMAGMATDAGYQVKEGMQNSVALTGAFRGRVGRPQRTIIWGKSLGGLIALGMIEKFPGLYDGAVALCPAAAGTPRRFDQFLDITVAYAAAFGWDPAWGTPGDLRDDLNFVTDVRPHLLKQLSPAKLGLWEFLRRVNGLPINSYYTASPGGLPERNLNLYFAMTTFTSDRNARNYAAHYVDPSGAIKRPVLTLHTTGDALAPPNHESAYGTTVEREGNSDLLMQQFSLGNGVANGHCTFSSAQVIAGVDAMMDWLDSGSPPDPSAFFPEALGFVPGYVPPPWPW
jgi:pimeloyl-ACP methyl ester carboxylesterase